MYTVDDLVFKTSDAEGGLWSCFLGPRVCAQVKILADNKYVVHMAGSATDVSSRSAAVEAILDKINYARAGFA
jgi:hypothetical protein